METKKKSLRMIGILLCICAVVFCGVFYYLSNYNLKVWYSLQNEEIQQEVRTQMEQYVKLSDEYWDYALQRTANWREQDKLSTDLAWAIALDEKFQEEYGDERIDTYASERAELQKQYDDLKEKCKGIELMMEYILMRREENWSRIEELGFRGQPTKTEMEEFLNSN